MRSVSVLKKWIGVLVLLVFPFVVQARVTGPCSNCHTMHNSQGGSVVAAGGPNESLLVSSCVGCHSSSSASTVVSGTPIVYSTSSAPTYPSDGTSAGALAGGNFYWVAQSGGDAKGHNVQGVTSDDSARFSYVPGSTTAYYQVTCAGTSGCHGDRTVSDQYKALYGAHHADDSPIDGTTVGTSFRFLDGILGKEDDDWEQSVGSADHNQYKGVDRANETQDDTSTISHLCAECHGDFHNGSGNLTPSGGTWGSPWLRHPTDYDMGNTPSGSEYRQYYYSTKGDNLYNPLVPLASADISAAISSVTFNDDTIVMCLSCHRAHGSPYDSIMRWDYKNWPGSGTNGCVVCHTSKD